MRIGVPKEIKVHEYRVGLVPAAVRELVESGHEVQVQSGAADGIGFDDAESSSRPVCVRAQPAVGETRPVNYSCDGATRSSANCCAARAQVASSSVRPSASCVVNSTSQ